MASVGMQHGAPQTPINFSSGTIAAIAATLLTQPTDMLRTHMQVPAYNYMPRNSMQ